MFVHSPGVTTHAHTALTFHSLSSHAPSFILFYKIILNNTYSDSTTLTQIQRHFRVNFLTTKGLTTLFITIIDFISKTVTKITITFGC